MDYKGRDRYEEATEAGEEKEEGWGVRVEPRVAVGHVVGTVELWEARTVAEVREEETEGFPTCGHTCNVRPTNCIPPVGDRCNEGS